LRQRLDFPVEEKVKTMDRQYNPKPKKWEKRLDFPIKEEIETMDSLAIIRG